MEMETKPRTPYDPMDFGKPCPSPTSPSPQHTRKASPLSVKAWSPRCWIRLKSSPPSILKRKRGSLMRDTVISDNANKVEGEVKGQWNFQYGTQCNQSHTNNTPLQPITFKQHSTATKSHTDNTPLQPNRIQTTLKHGQIRFHVQRHANSFCSLLEFWLPPTVKTWSWTGVSKLPFVRVLWKTGILSRAHPTYTSWERPWVHHDPVLLREHGWIEKCIADVHIMVGVIGTSTV